MLQVQSTGFLHDFTGFYKIFSLYFQIQNSAQDFYRISQDFTGFHRIFFMVNTSMGAGVHKNLGRARGTETKSCYGYINVQNSTNPASFGMGFENPDLLHPDTLYQMSQGVLDPMLYKMLLFRPFDPKSRVPEAYVPSPPG
ncbi:hypothetical protein BDC45DRAFT_533001 [Circinella umbellata]|nr:hypothetical protein BDC45DRAFT_533001 [Circinella umbellata]